MPDFASSLVAWQRRHGRKGLPWQATRNPYHVWLSEIMLQQTQVSAVLPYYQRFLERFPDIDSLARASQEDVLKLWSGLGYYARGRNLHAAARRIALGGCFPDTVEALVQLPGIGRSTAGAIAALAFGRRAPVLDGNARRVLARCFAIESETKLWKLAERLLPTKHIGIYTQALMDLGATVCTKGQPRCDACPVKRRCVARRTGRAAELPAPRPRKELPLKKATWFILLHKHEVLLVRRPSQGLWGGLWTFPEAMPQGLRVKARRRLEPREHSFTHFRLRAQALACEVKNKVEVPNGLWLDFGDARGAAIPAPVKTLLLSLASEQAV